MPSAFQQPFAGNSTYHQSLAAVLPQYKNSVSVSSLPQSASVASGYGGFGNTASIPGNFPMNPAAAPSGTNLSYDDMLSSQYKDTNHLMSLQQVSNSLAINAVRLFKVNRTNCCRLAFSNIIGFDVFLIWTNSFDINCFCRSPFFLSMI